MIKTNPTLFWTILLFALALIGAGCHSAGSAYEFDEGSNVLIMALQEEQGLAIVDATQWAPGSESSITQGTATSGAGKIVGAMQGQETGEALKFVSDPAPQNLWFDLTQPIGGILFVDSAVSQAELGKVRVELYVDGEYGGGYENDFGHQNSGAGFDGLNIHFRPEVRLIPAGSIVEIHVTQVTGLADFKVGTGGDIASHLAVAYSKLDPLAGALILEDGKLIKAAPSNGSADPEETESQAQMLMVHAQNGAFDDLGPGYYVVDPEGEKPKGSGIGLIGLGAALLLPAIGLVAMGGRLRLKHGLTALMILSVALSGCAKGDAQFQGVEDDEKVIKPSVNETHEKIEEGGPDEVKEGLGIVRGQTLDYFGLPIGFAHVSFLGTSLFTQSDKEGAFEFLDVPAGQFKVRVDAKGWESIERVITVREGEVTRLTFKMVPPGNLKGDQLSHIHDEWGGQTRKLVEKTEPFTVRPETSLASQDANGVPFCINPANQDGEGPQGQMSGDACVWDVPTSFDNRILPGTGTVEVIVHWNDEASNAPSVMGVAVTNPASSTFYLNQYLARETGVPTMIQIFPNEADPGHQQFTNWEFRIFIPKNEFIAPFGQQVYEIPEIQVEIYIHKSVVPFEPPHVDKWGEATEFVLQDGEERVNWCCYYTPQTSATVVAEEGGWWSVDGYYWDVLDGGLVPPGTSHVEGRLIWDPTAIAAGATYPSPSAYADYTVAYKPANVPFADAQGNLKVITDFEKDGEDIIFSFKPDGKELDQWYQNEGQWQFWLVAKPKVYNGYWYGTYYQLDAKAIKDPNWKFVETAQANAGP